MAGMLTRYKDIPAFFFQKAPQDTDPNWQKPSFPRVVYDINMLHNPERKSRGVLIVNIWSTTECTHMPEDIEKRMIELIDGTFYSKELCAVWNNSESVSIDSPFGTTQDSSPEIFGKMIVFDLLPFPSQLTCEPDPITGLNRWTKEFFPNLSVVSGDKLPKSPAIYWRLVGTAADDKQSFSVNWYTGEFAAHVINGSIDERNRLTKEISEQILLHGEIILPDGSPMFVKQVKILHNACPVREGQFSLTGMYGVLASQRKLNAVYPLNNAKMEVRVNGGQS
jgi:hypothetical protein